VDIKSWDIQNLFIVYQTFKLPVKIKIVSLLFEPKRSQINCVIQG
jgi:hypothetical protein